MRAISLKCPNCNAHLKAGETAAVVVCSYCGTEARVQHRTRFLERKIEMPQPQTAQRRLPVAKQRHGFRFMALFGVLPPLMVAGGVFFAVAYQAGGIDKIGDAIIHAKDSVLGDNWSYGGGGNALLYDVNGDGHVDVIGHARYVQREDSYYLAAFDGLTGDKLWESETIGNHSDSISGKSILHGEFIAQADSRGNIAGYSVSDGKRLWKHPLGEKLKEVCANGETSLALKLSDKSWKSIELPDGTMTKMEHPPEDCKRVAVHKKHSQRSRVHLGHGRRSKARSSLGKIESMKVRDVVKLVDEPGHLVALGHKSPGTKIPMVAYLSLPPPETSDEEADKSEGKKRKKRKKRKSRAQPKAELVWAKELPALDPLAAKEEAPSFVAISKGYIVSVYQPKNGNPRVVCFTREGGQRLWDKALPGTATVLTAIDISEDRVYVTQWGRLDAFSIESGSVAFTIGG